MPVDGIDIWRSANIIHGLHGDGAVAEAMRRSTGWSGSATH